MAASRPGPGERHTLEHFAAWCEAFIVLDNFEPLVLEDFQRVLLADHFAGARETLVLLPSSNGKTTLFGALALYHLVFTAYAECYIAAAARDQAKLMYDHARGFVERNRELARVQTLDQLVDVKKGTFEIRSKSDTGFIRVLASDAGTQDGKGPTLALVDELHRHKTDDLYAVLRKGLKKRGGRMLTISTAGSDLETPLGRMRTRALEQPGARRDDVYTHSRSPNGHSVLHEWSLDEDLHDPDDLAAVKRANPAAFVTLEDLSIEHANSEPWNWARYACNLWRLGEDAAVAVKTWAALGVDGLQVPAGQRGVGLGIDLGWKWDTTALVAIQDRGAQPDPAEKRFRIAPPTILIPPRDNTSLDYDVVWEAVKAIADRWPLEFVVLDPNAGGERLARELERKLGLRVILQSQKHGPMALCAARWMEVLRDEDLEHPEHPEFTRHVLSARARFVSGVSSQQSDRPFIFDKPQKTRACIDGLDAASMCLSTHIGRSLAPRRKPRVKVLR